ncbi:uncharacterized protein [Anolis sagrei]|uniref:uncharacterized protein n=1 Tax=Anolis sagrei TaxID=38937 RepID=UPI003521B182
MALVPQSLERALGVLVCTFQRYCRKDGERHTLSRKQLKALLEEELPSLRCLRLRDSTLEELMATLDKDRDGQVSFPEFVRFVAATCTFFHDFFRDRSTALPPKVSILDGARPPEPEEEEEEKEEEGEEEEEGEVEGEVEEKLQRCNFGPMKVPLLGIQLYHFGGYKDATFEETIVLLLHYVQSYKGAAKVAEATKVQSYKATKVPLWWP